MKIRNLAPQYTQNCESRVRRVDMSPYLAHELRQHKFSCSFEDSGFVFCNSEGKPLNPDYLVKRHFLPALT